MFLQILLKYLGRLFGKARCEVYSARRSRPAAIGYAFERLEHRLTLTANISATDVTLLDTSFNPVTTVSPGQSVYVEVDFQTVDLPANASYNIAFTVNGFTLSTGPLTIGAGVAGATDHVYDWGKFVVTPGSNQISANVDPGQSVTETSYSDNMATATVNAVAMATGPLSYSVSQIRTAYGINSLQDFDSAFADGSGQTIAIVDEFNDPNIFSDLDGFDNSMDISTGNDVTLSRLYGSASSFLSVYNQSGADITSQIANSGVGAVPPVDSRFAANPGGSWEGEETLDVEWAHAIAPGAHIDLIETTGSGAFGGLYIGAAAAAAIPGVSVVSMSWSWNENNWTGLAGEQSLDSTFTTPNGHTGVTFLASAGDAGAPDSYPSFSPNVIGVGGTQLTTNGYAYDSETAWSFGNSRKLVNGDSSYSQYGTGNWTPINQGFNSSATTAPAGADTTAQWTTPVSSTDQGGYGGIEVSATWVPAATNATNATYSIYYTDANTSIVLGNVTVDQTKAPVGTLDGTTNFQDLGVYYPNIPNAGGQITVRLDASTANGTVCADTIGIGPAWATGGGQSLYEPEPSYQASVQNSGFRAAPDVAFDASISSGVTTWQGGDSFGGFGTSLSAPCWAGIMAIVNQGRVAAGGSPFDSSTDPTEALQAIYSLPAADFHDITTGYNGLSAGPGYDELTGRGTPVANLLVPDLVAYGLPVGLKFTTEPATEISAGSPLDVTVTAEYPNGSIDMSYAGPVNIGIATELGAGTLSGTTTVNAVQGVATFSLSIAAPGSGYSLNATADGPVSTTTDSFTIYSTAPTVLVSDPGGVFNGSPFGATGSVTSYTGANLGTPTFKYYLTSDTMFASPLLGAPSTVGSYVVVASFAGDGINPLATNSTGFSITPATPTVNSVNPVGITYGTALANSQLTGSASVPGTFSYASATTTVLNAGNGQIETVTFTPSDSLDYKTVTSTVTVNVIKAMPAVTIHAGGTYNANPIPAAATATGVGGATVSGSFALTYHAGTGTSNTGSSTAPTSAGTYTVVASFTSTNSNYGNAHSAPVTFTISPAAPIVVVSSPSGPYTGHPFPVTATAKGIGGVTVSGNLVFMYYVGSSANGTGSSTAPTNANTYTVVASFTSTNSNYGNAHSAPVTFTISPATPNVVAHDVGGTYNGNPFAATATTTGVGNAMVSGSFAFTYYVGTGTSSTGSSTAPASAGTYTAVARFTSTNSNYGTALSAPVTFKITTATPIVAAYDVGGTYNGNPFAATATAIGVGGATVSGRFAFTFYVGSGVNGTGSSTAPTAAGTYTVIATFTSANSDYTNARSMPVTFTINSATTQSHLGVTGNGHSMTNGTTTTSTSNDTAFGITSVGSSSSETYTITNNGTAGLSVGSLWISGANPSDFNVSRQPGTWVIPGHTTTFTVQFAPTAPGARSATINFLYSESSPNVLFMFAVSGVAARMQTPAAAAASLADLALAVQETGTAQAMTAKTTSVGTSTVSSGLPSTANAAASPLSVNPANTTASIIASATFTSHQNKNQAIDTLLADFDPSELCV